MPKAAFGHPSSKLGRKNIPHEKIRKAYIFAYYPFSEMEEESNWWHGIIQLRFTKYYEGGGSIAGDRHYYFMKDERPLYELLREIKIENIEVRGVYWGENPTTQSELHKHVPEPGRLDPIDLEELTKKLEGHDLKGIFGI